MTGRPDPAVGLPRLTTTPTHCGAWAVLVWHERRFRCIQCWKVLAVYVCGDDDDDL